MPLSLPIRRGRWRCRSTHAPHDQAEHEEGQELDSAQRANLDGRGPQRDDGDQGHGEPSDLRPELADQVGRPELGEIRPPPEVARHISSGDRFLSSCLPLVPH